MANPTGSPPAPPMSPPRSVYPRPKILAVPRPVVSSPIPATEPAATTPEEKKEEAAENSMTVLDHLKVQLGNAWVLYANYKHYHWQVAGPNFPQYHELFDKLAGAVLDTIDDLAERARMLGSDVDDVRLEDFQKAATVESAAGGQSADVMLQQAHSNVLIVIKAMREAAHEADEEMDAGSVDLFSKIVQVHEKAEWFLRMTGGVKPTV